MLDICHSIIAEVLYIVTYIQTKRVLEELSNLKGNGWLSSVDWFFRRLLKNISSLLEKNLKQFLFSQIVPRQRRKTGLREHAQISPLIHRTAQYITVHYRTLPLNIVQYRTGERFTQNHSMNFQKLS